MTPPNEMEDESKPGGIVVVLALFTIFALPAGLLATFVFPPAYVAALLAFGPVTLLGFGTLVIHFRAADSGD